MLQGFFFRFDKVVTVQPTRRAYLGALTTGSLASIAGCAAMKSNPTTAPESIPSLENEYIIEEVHGELILDQDNQYWLYELPEYSGCVHVEYEVSVRSGDSGLFEVITLTRNGDTKFTEGRYPPAWKSGFSDGDFVDQLTTTSTDSGDFLADGWSNRIFGKPHSILFDASPVEIGDVENDPRRNVGEIVLDVSIRVRKSLDESAEEAATDVISTLYESPPLSASDGYSEIVDAATYLCRAVSDSFEGVTVDDLKTLDSGSISPIEVIQETLLGLDDEDLIKSPMVQGAVQNIETLLKWTSTLLPVYGATKELLASACRLYDATSLSKQEEHANEFMLNVGVLLLEILFASFGALGRVPGRLLEAADSYILATIKEAAGFKVFLTLLYRYCKLVYGLRSVWEWVKQKAREVARDVGGLFTEEEQQELEALSSEDDLESLSSLWECGDEAPA